MSYEDFYNSCEMKGYAYVNFKMAYDKWNSKEKNQKENNNQPSFIQIL